VEPQENERVGEGRPKAAAVGPAVLQPYSHEHAQPETESQEKEPLVEEPPKAKAVDPEILLAQARELRANGNYVSAIDTYEKVLQRAPRLIPLVIKDLEALVAEESVPLSTHRLLGDAYSMAGRFKEALEQYRMVLGR
jgi:tetratricopeptide (TPR) repeat protein